MANKHLWATKITSNDAAAKEQLGILRKEWNSTDACFKTYRYVQALAATTVANGTCLMQSDTLGQVVTSVVASASRNQPAGVGVGAITASYYGWVQTGGYHSAVLTDGGDDIADGDTVIMATGNGVCDSVAAGTASTHRPLGIAVAADVDGSDTVATYLTVAEV